MHTQMNYNGTSSRNPNSFMIKKIKCKRGNIYEQTILQADKLEITQVDISTDADVFFPKIEKKIWVKTKEIAHQKDEKNQYNYSFQTWEKLENL